MMCFRVKQHFCPLGNITRQRVECDWVNLIGLILMMFQRLGTHWENILPHTFPRQHLLILRVQSTAPPGGGDIVMRKIRIHLKDYGEAGHCEPWRNFVLL